MSFFSRLPLVALAMSSSVAPAPFTLVKVMPSRPPPPTLGWFDVCPIREEAEGLVGCTWVAAALPEILIGEDIHNLVVPGVGPM